MATKIAAKLGGRWEERLWPLSTAPRNIYIAASLKAVGEARHLALKLMDAGFNVASRWLRHNFSYAPDIDDNWSEYVTLKITMGEVNLLDLAEADTLIVLGTVPSTSGGLHVELGYFLGSEKCGNIVVVGDRPNVFFFTDKIRFMPNADALCSWLLRPTHGK